MKIKNYKIDNNNKYKNSSNNNNFKNNLHYNRRN